MKKIFIFIMIMFFSPVVFAREFNVSTKVKSSPSSSKGYYKATEIYNTGTSNTYAINTRYNGRLSYIEFYLDSDDWDWDYNTTYTVTMNMATSDWRNHFQGIQAFRTNTDGTIPSTATNFYVSNSFQFVSMKKIKFNIKIGNTMGIYTKFVIPSSNVSSTAFTGESNWNLSSIIISTISNPTPTPAPVTPTPTPRPTPTPAPTGATNQDIINSQNSNTTSIINNQNNNTNSIINNQNSNNQSLINNQNSNTQSIIDSNTQNTSDIIENNNENSQNIIDNNDLSSINSQRNSFDTTDKNCGFLYRYNLSKGYAFYSGGSTYIDQNSYYTSDFIPINLANTMVLTGFSDTSTNVGTFIFYDISFNYISYKGVRNQSFSVPSGAIYFKYSTTVPSGMIFKNKGCTSKIDETNEKLNDINNSINNSNVDDKSGFFTGFQDNDHGLTSILTIPLSTIQQLTNTSCVALSLPIPFTNSNVSLPCMTEVYQNFIPSIFNIWQVVSFGLISYWICLDIYRMVKGFKDPNEDKVEVLDL